MKHYQTEHLLNVILNAYLFPEESDFIDLITDGMIEPEDKEMVGMAKKLWKTTRSMI